MIRGPMKRAPHKPFVPPLVTSLLPRESNDNEIVGRPPPTAILAVFDHLRRCNQLEPPLDNEMQEPALLSLSLSRDMLSIDRNADKRDVNEARKDTRERIENRRKQEIGEQAIEKLRERENRYREIVREREMERNAGWIPCCPRTRGH